MSNAGIKIIQWYKNKISPKTGIECLFVPSCSEYTKLAVKKYGFFKGVFMGLGRIKRCRPGNGGVDYP
ncbi:MAG TPA: membrane protein insertion efficiency factor YidD [Firmicutes bacterium]|nr:membrane protein insertion efficiency factor YidD [Bacillota bacterium]